MSLPQVGRSLGHFLYATAQAPWRAQRQWMGGVLVVVVVLAMVASLYLDVTSQAAIAGRQIQDLTSQIVAIRQSTSDLQSKLAVLTSTSAMQKRAEDLGYQPILTSQLQYVVVPGYKPPESAMLAGAQALKPSAARMPPEYTESLIAWLNRRLGSSSMTNSGENP